METEILPAVKCVESDRAYGRFVAEPLMHGFGITLGNALRRVLLSSLPGAAITRIRIEGVLHEFTTIPNIKEDATEFVLNVKGIRLRSLTHNPAKLALQASGAGPVTAGNIKPSADFEVVNPDLYLATLDSDEATLAVELYAEEGKGYRPAGQSDGLPIGSVPVDAIFTPVTKVNYSVERTRVGQMTDYDRLILEVWTDGTVTALDAVSRSAEILVHHFFLFSDLSRAAEKGPAEGEEDERFRIPIDQLGLSTRTLNCLRRSNITTVGQILKKTKKELLEIQNFGQKSLEELTQKLQSLGFIIEEAEAKEAEASPPEEGQPPVTEEGL